MTAAKVLSFSENNGGLQLYVPVDLRRDSRAFDLEADRQYLVHTLDCGGLIVLPMDSLPETYPLTIANPPPRTFDRVADDDGVDFSTLPFSRRDLRRLAADDSTPTTDPTLQHHD